MVTDEDVPGDIVEDDLRDSVRKSMVGLKYKEKLDMKKFKFRQYSNVLKVLKRVSDEMWEGDACYGDTEI